MKSEKGYTGVDIAISIIVLFIFISIISILSYQFNSTAKEMELKAQATTIAVDEIENMKNKSIEDIEIENTEYRKTTEVQEGFYRTINVQDYHDIDETKMAGLVKKVTVRIQYKSKKDIETIEFSTIISKEI